MKEGTNMNTVLVKDLYSDFSPYVDKEITVAGWIRSIRASSNFGFMVINDGTHFGTLQIVMDAEIEGYKELSKLNVGSAVIAKGKLVATPDAKQDFELQAVNIDVEGESAADYPLQKKRHGFEFLRTIEHLRARTNTFSAVFRVRSLTAFAIHQFFNEQLPIRELPCMV